MVCRFGGTTREITDEKSEGSQGGQGAGAYSQGSHDAMAIVRANLPQGYRSACVPMSMRGIL